MKIKSHFFENSSIDKAIKEAEIKIQELRTNLIIKELNNNKIEVIEKREINNEIKRYLLKLLKNIGISAEIIIDNKKEIPKFNILSDNDSILIGKNGKNLKALSIITSQYINKILNITYKFIIDVAYYNEKRKKKLEILAVECMNEVIKTKIDIKLDSMNSYERRIIHEKLKDNKNIKTESVGEEPNRYIVIKYIK